MGKKNKSGGDLGRALINSRFKNNRGKKMVADRTMLHTTEIQDGYDWGRLNLQSVTEESSFQEFLSTAELTNDEFQAEKLNIKFINPKSTTGLLTKDEMKKTKESHDKHKEFIKIPRRPPWNSSMSKEELDQNEKQHFLEWRRTLAKLQEEEGILLTPYEKNLEFWRQLWRVVERSDVVVQIVDARNPLLFRCEDLEKYVKEVSTNKLNITLVNKADFLTEKQRQYWADYFTSIGVNAVFYSALPPPTPEESDDDNITKTKTESNDDLEESDDDIIKTPETNDQSVDDLKEKVKELEEQVENTAQKLHEITEKIGGLDLTNSSRIITQDELIDLCSNIHHGVKVTPNITTIGLVGYPNVGKSSTINSLFSSKKVSVSATPGKTKHFQTLYLTNDILLCDCPGLVMPSFVYTKAEMVINGILPIDQMRDHVPPVNLVCNLIPRHVLEDKYGIMLPVEEGQDPKKPPSAEQLLNAYGFNRGFMTANGQPDNPRSSRYILKDFINGKLLYCNAPPNVEQSEYHSWPERQKVHSDKYMPPRMMRAIKPIDPTAKDVDDSFFGVKTKGRQPIPSITPGGSVSAVPGQLGEKPWKKINKHANKNKKEKLRRVYAHLDQH